MQSEVLKDWEEEFSSLNTQQNILTDEIAEMRNRKDMYDALFSDE